MSDEGIKPPPPPAEPPKNIPFGTAWPAERGSPPESSPNNESAPKTLEEAQRLKEDSWSQTMDEMEDDRKEAGPYFAKFGDKNLGPDKVDTRTLVLRSDIAWGGDLGNQARGWVIITRDGAKFVSPIDSKYDQRMPQEIERRFKQETETGFTPAVSDGYNGSTWNLGDYPILRLNGEPFARVASIPTGSIISRAIAESKKATEDQVQIYKAEQSARLAKDVRSVLKPPPTPSQS